jgi:hypothetical protein
MTKRQVKFTDRSEEVSITLHIPSGEPDFWTIAKGYKVHYCEDYQEICVYRDNDHTYKTIHNEKI